MSDDLHGLPHPYEVEAAAMRRLDLVQTAVALRLPEGAMLQQFQDLNMAMYEDRYENLWIGYAETNLSNHDRWLAVAHPPRVAKHDARPWRTVNTEHHLENGIFSQVTHDSIMMAKFRLNYEYAMSLNVLRRHLHKTSVPLSRLAVYMDLFDISDQHAIISIDGAPDLVELHELAHHYPNWQAANPEAAGMPQELVWRMHGLAGLLGAAAR